MVTMNVEYQGTMRCRAAHEPSGTVIEMDAPVDIGGGGTRFSPTDLVGAALAGCILTTMGMVADRRGVDLTLARARVEKHMTTDARRRIARFDVTIRLAADTPAAVRPTLERAARVCPVHASLSPDVQVNLVFDYSA